MYLTPAPVSPKPYPGQWLLAMGVWLLLLLALAVVLLYQADQLDEPSLWCSRLMNLWVAAQTLSLVVLVTRL